MKIAILTDSGSAMSQQQAREAGLYLVPLQVIDDKDSFQDGIEISTKQLYDRLRQNHIPKTSLPITSVIMETMAEIKGAGYDAIIAVPLSSGLSGTGQAMHMCAQDVGIPLTIVENYTTCDLEGYIAKLVHHYMLQGKSINEILQLVNKKVETSGTYVLPNDIQHLKRGGRLTPLAAAAASLLKIKPILKIGPQTNGKIDVVGKVRTEAKATKQVIDQICEQFKDRKGTVYVIHSDALSRAEMIRDAIHDRCPQLTITLNTISAVISAHTGLDCIAVQYIEA